MVGVVSVQQFKARLEYSAAVLKIAWPRFKQCIALLITNYQVRRAASCAGLREEQEGQREKSARTSCVVCAYRSVWRSRVSFPENIRNSLSTLFQWCQMHAFERR